MRRYEKHPAGLTA